MAYKSLFQPISESDMTQFRNSHAGWYDIENYDPRALFEQDGVDASAAAPVIGADANAQAQNPQNPNAATPDPNAQAQTGNTNPQNPQTGAAPDANAQAQNPQNPNGGAPDANAQAPQQAQTPDANAQGGQTPDNIKQQIFNDDTWKAFFQNPSMATFEPFSQKFQQFMSKLGQQPSNNAAATGNGANNSSVTPQSTQTPVGGQQPIQPQNSSLNLNYSNRMNESDNDGSDDDNESSTSKSSASSSTTKSSTSTSKEFDDTKDVKYDGTYKKNDGGSESETDWDAQMRKSIFGTSEDPFDEDNDVKYSSEYGNKVISNSDRDKVGYNIKPTSPEPFKPEKPSFTSLSNPNALSKTVFTTGKVDIKDAPTVGSSAPVAGTKNSGSSSTSTSKKSQDDGSDDANESFLTNYDKFLNESSISDSLKKVIIQEFLNEFEGEFDIAEFNDWLESNYPQIASDPGAFDEIVSSVEDRANSGDFVVTEDDEEEDVLITDEHGEEVSISDAVEEYLEQYDGEDYDEEDATDWFYENFEDDEDLLEEFLDELSDQFIEDDINESFDDEFFANEMTLND